MAKASDNVFPKVIVSAGTAPATPSAGQGKIYEKSADGKLYFKNDAGTEYDLTASGSSTFVGAGAERSTNQSISNGTWTAVQFNDADVYDTDAIHDTATNNSRLTIPTGKTGKWRFTATAFFAQSSGGAVRAIGWAKNGTLTAGRYGHNYRTPISSTFTAMNTSVDLNLTAGDYIEVNVYQDSGGALNVTDAYVTCQFLG